MNTELYILLTIRNDKYKFGLSDIEVMLTNKFLKYRKDLDDILNDKLPEINGKLKASGIKEIKVITREEYDKS